MIQPYSVCVTMVNYIMLPLYIVYSIYLVVVVGYWYLHCHVEGHVEMGQAAVLQIGEPEEMPPTPAKFPTCGNFKL